MTATDPIKDDMEVIGADGVHVGTVERLLRRNLAGR